MRTTLLAVGFAALLLFPAMAISAEISEKSVIEFEGVLRPFEDMVITSETSSKVVAVNVREGDHVKTDQVLIELDKTDQTMKLELAEIALEREKLKFDTALTEFEEAGGMNERSIASRAELDKAKREYQLAKLSMQEAQINLQKAKKNLQLTTIRSPIDGTIAAIAKKAGDSVVSGQELVHVIDAQELLLIAHIPSSCYGRVKKGMEIIFKTEYTEETFRTSVESIVPLAEDNDLFKITAVVVNRSFKLLPETGVSCSMKLR